MDVDGWMWVDGVGAVGPCFIVPTARQVGLDVDGWMWVDGCGK